MELSVPETSPTLIKDENLQNNFNSQGKFKNSDFLKVLIGFKLICIGFLFFISFNWIKDVCSRKIHVKQMSNMILLRSLFYTCPNKFPFQRSTMPWKRNQPPLQEIYYFAAHGDIKMNVLFGLKQTSTGNHVMLKFSSD
ncbi:hypothetical protein CEXT_807691 [Caerostris extrusa]|uniref:Uncharacterized protein n=1 Tax=Caerostris extrusa TaxID=172846 RepID=A0AAV4WTS5_CAEEX|nr:hypothetical protein CEXT_807691 [Caerostris extrusa]